MTNLPKCRLLVLTPQLPYPPDQGAPIRNWNFLRYLGSTSTYDITLLSFARPDEHNTAAESAALRVLHTLCRRVEIVVAPPPRSKASRLQALITNRVPDLALRLASSAFGAKLRELLETEGFDALLCEGLELAAFVMATLPIKAHRPRLILDEHNAEWLLQQRAYQNDREAGPRRYPAAVYSLVQAHRLRRYEAQALNFFDLAIAVSLDDKAALLEIGGADHKIKVIPNGINLDEFAPTPSAIIEPDTLVFTGTMDFRPNVDAVTWFAREIWPIIRAHKPAARFTIVGRRPAPAVVALAQLPGIVVTGSVPDARPYIQRSSVYVVPMRIGGGVRFKVLEALAMGKAVVTTPMGADGIALTPDHEAIVATEPAAFARAVLTLLDNPSRRQQLGETGRAFVMAHYGWPMLTPLLDPVLMDFS